MMTKRIALLLAAGLMAAGIPALQSNASVPSGVRFLGAHVVRGDLGPAGTMPLKTARKTLDRFAPFVGVDPEGFRFETVRRSLIGTHVRGREFRGGVPVDGSSVAVHMMNARVVQLDVNSVAGTPGGAAANPVSAVVAQAGALGSLGVTNPLRVSSDRLLVARGDSLVDTWRVNVVSLVPAIAAAVDVDAASGAVTRILDTNDYIDGSSMIFNPNPIVSTQDNTLRQPGETGQPADADLDSPELTAARVELPLKELSDTDLLAGHLVGPWVTVVAEGLNSIDGKFNYTRSDPRFEATMAYAHLDAVQRYFQKLGFVGEKGVNAESQDIVAMPVQGFDNSFYQPGNDLMLMGAGGVDDAEDAEVIVHEYGHAVQDAQVQGWGATHEGGSMGEGFGDFLAADFYGRTISKGFQDECLMDWDATSYSSEDPTCIRRLDRAKKYPDDMEGAVHADGEIWSGFLWTLRQSLGKSSIARSDNVTKLVLSSHELLTPQAQFGDAVAALRTAAKGLGHKAWGKKVNKAANLWGLPLNPK